MLRDGLVTVQAQVPKQKQPPKAGAAELVFVRVGPSHAVSGAGQAGAVLLAPRGTECSPAGAGTGRTH